MALTHLNDQILNERLNQKMGTIVDDPLDFYTTRVPRKEKKNTILEELIEDAKIKKFLSFFLFSNEKTL